MFKCRVYVLVVVNLALLQYFKLGTTTYFKLLCLSLMTCELGFLLYGV